MKVNPWYSRGRSKLHLWGRQQAVLKVLSEYGQATTRRISNLTGIPMLNCWDTLTRLCRLDLVVRYETGVKHSYYWKLVPVLRHRKF